jgi:hypothetical protein
VAAQQGFRSLQYFVVLLLERLLGHGGSASRDS